MHRASQSEPPGKRNDVARDWFARPLWSSVPPPIRLCDPRGRQKRRVGGEDAALLVRSGRGLCHAELHERLELRLV